MKDDTTNALPQLGLKKLSVYFADLLLTGAGEGAAMRHQKTRRAWHFFFFSVLTFLVWYLIIRIAIAPSFSGNLRFVVAIRTIEVCMYVYLIGTLAFLIYCHHRFMLVPRLSFRFRTLVFFLVVMIFLFSRVYYSLYHINSAHFNFSGTATLPTSHFGIHGSDDLLAALEFVILSSAIVLNSSYTLIQPQSVLACTIAIVQSGVGFIFIAILIATFVEITADRKQT